jgi:oligosaccharide repeat unit polymerase
MRFVWQAGAIVLFGAIAFSAGTVVAGNHRIVRVPRTVVVPNGRLIRAISLFGGLAGFAAAVLALRGSGFGLSSLTSLNRYLATGNTVDVNLVTQGAPLPIPILLSFTYLGAFIAPFAPKGRYARSYIAAPTIGALAYAAVSTRRESFLLCAGLTLASLIIAEVLRTGRPPKISWKHILATVFALGALATVFVALAFVRVGRGATAVVNHAVLAKLEVTAFGYLGAFSSWLSPVGKYQPPSGRLTWGSQTFSGLLGLHGVSKGYADSRVVLPQVGPTNIFTAYRPLLQDFGRPGTILVLFVLGFACQLAWLSVQRRQSLGAALLLAVVYAYILNSATQSLFIFLNVCLALIAGVAIIRGPAIRRRPTLTTSIGVPDFVENVPRSARRIKPREVQVH